MYIYIYLFTCIIIPKLILDMIARSDSIRRLSSLRLLNSRFVLALRRMHHPPLWGFGALRRSSCAPRLRRLRAENTSMYSNTSIYLILMLSQSIKLLNYFYTDNISLRKYQYEF